MVLSNVPVKEAGKNRIIRDGKYQIHLVYNKETLLFYCCSSYSSSQTTLSTMRKCFNKKKLCIKMFWYVYINVNNNDFLLFPILQMEDRRSSLQWWTWGNIGNVSTIKWFLLLVVFPRSSWLPPNGTTVMDVEMAYVADSRGQAAGMFASDLRQLQAFCLCL